MFFVIILGKNEKKFSELGNSFIYINRKSKFFYFSDDINS